MADVLDEKKDAKLEVAEEQPEQTEIEADLDEDEENEDALSFNNGVIEKIVALALRDVEGVVGMKGGFMNRVQDVFGQTSVTKGVSVEVMPTGAVKVNVAIFIAYGAYAPKVFEDIKNAVINAMNDMTGLEVAGVNLRIEDVLTEEDLAKRAPREQPRIEAAEEPVAELPEETEEA